MGIYETYTKKKTLPIPDEGPQVALCVKVSEFEVQERDYNDPAKTVTAQKVQYTFESPDGGISESKRFNAKWGPKSRHYQFIEAWLGRKPPIRFDSQLQVGQWAKINVEHKVGDKVTFANIVSIKPADPAAIPADFTPTVFEDEGEDEPVPF